MIFECYGKFNVSFLYWIIEVMVFDRRIVVKLWLCNVMTLTTSPFGFKFDYVVFCLETILSCLVRCGSRISSRGAQLLSPKVADVAKRSHASKVSNVWPESSACLRVPEAFGFLMFKYAFLHIPETFFSNFWHLFQHLKQLRLRCSSLHPVAKNVWN